MAEFQDVMNQWHRLCQAMTDKNPKDACNGCPLGAYGCSPVYEALDSYRDVDFEVVGETIMSWAAEHPEPVYPSWVTWLADQGVLVCDVSYPNMRYWYSINKQKIEQPIPADIAEKLGLEPEEG